MKTQQKRVVAGHPRLSVAFLRSRAASGSPANRGAPLSRWATGRVKQVRNANRVAVGAQLTQHQPTPVRATRALPSDTLERV